EHRNQSHSSHHGKNNSEMKLQRQNQRSTPQKKKTKESNTSESNFGRPSESFPQKIEFLWMNRE
ncbi:MAG: hypothetical protein BRC53_00890, partial [Cyanobacteria bacterium SW_6_48_11]